MKSQTLFMREGSADKTYQVTLESVAGVHKVIGYGGRRGGTQTAYPKYEGRDAVEAERIYAKLLAEKTNKGYRPGEDAAPVAGPAPVVDHSIAHDYRPMLLNSIEPEEVEKYINDHAWLMETKEDGVHAVIIVSPDGVMAYSRSELPVALTVDQVTLLKRHFANTILDSEVIGPRLVLFDLLAANGTDLRGYPCEERLRGLTALFEAVPAELGPAHGGVGSVFLIESAHTKPFKREMLQRLHSLGAEGLVLKRKDAPYTAGRPSAGGPCLKLKFKASATLRVVAIGSKGKASIDVALQDGTVVASASTIGRPIPSVGSLAEIEYLYAYRGGKLVQPVYKTIRTDKKRADTAETLQYKGEERNA